MTEETNTDEKVEQEKVTQELELDESESQPEAEAAPTTESDSSKKKTASESLKDAWKQVFGQALSVALKGRGNVKNGNRHLANAFGQAANHARRHDDRVRAFYSRKKRKTNDAVAHASVAHKLARATYHMMNTGERFVSERAFG